MEKYKLEKDSTSCKEFMKLKNKATGEIKEARIANGHLQVWSENVMEWFNYDDLDYLAKWWERYEEPKEHWAIDQFGEPINTTGLSRLQLEKLRQYGNDFETKEETEKEIKRLKAYVILKEDTKGFKPSWKNKHILKYTVVYDWNRLEFDVVYNFFYQKGTIVFGTLEDAQSSIDNHRQEWLNYLGIEEED